MLNPSLEAKLKKNSRQDILCQGIPAGEFVPNPADCTRFYLCGENGEAIAAQCPHNMIFNAATRLCDVANNVECRQLTTTQMTTAAPTTTAQLPTPVMPDNSATAEYYCASLYNQQPDANSLVFLSHSSNCQRYYMCFHGNALLQECSAQLHWNAKISKCDIPERAQCELDTWETGANPASPTVAPGANDDDNFQLDGISCPPYGQFIFPHIERCDFFIYCVKGIAILQKCPFYHYFDVELGKCQWRSRALCIKDLNLNYFRQQLNKNFH